MQRKHAFRNAGCLNSLEKHSPISPSVARVVQYNTDEWMDGWMNRWMHKVYKYDRESNLIVNMVSCNAII